MTYPTSWITCEKCQKTYSGDFASGKYIYELAADAQLDLDRQLGWCDDCWSVIEMEDLSTDKLSEQLEVLRSQLHAATRGISKIIPAKRKAANALREKIRELAKHKAYRMERSTSERCLRCGSPHVSPLPDLNWPSKSGVYVRNTWTHPGCGGTMLTHGDDTHFSDTSPLVVYDKDGNFSRTVDRGW